MRPDKQFKEEQLKASVEEAAKIVREQEMSVEEEAAEVEELKRELMAAELAAQNKAEQERKGKEISEQIQEAGGS